MKMRIYSPIDLKQIMTTLYLTKAASVLEQYLMDGQSEQWTNAEFIHRLLSYELKERENKQLETRLRRAWFSILSFLDHLV